MSNSYRPPSGPQPPPRGGIPNPSPSFRGTPSQGGAGATLPRQPSVASRGPPATTAPIMPRVGSAPPTTASRAEMGSFRGPRGQPPPRGVGSSSMMVSSTSQGLDVRKAISSYFERIVSSITDMKAVLFDEETKWVISMVYTQTQILEKAVYLTASLIPHPPKLGELKQQQREKMPHLKGVILCRPTDVNVYAIINELENPLYGEYHLFFTEFLPPMLLSKLAEGDKHSVVKQVQECYCDYLAVNSDLFDFHVSGTLKLSIPRPKWTPLMEEHFRRSIQGMISVLLSLRQKPTIRYQAGSELAQHFSRELLHDMDKERSVFEWGNAAPPSNSSGETLLLILDRREDPVTPLLNQWTYQAMVHELLGDGLQYNVIDLGEEWVRQNQSKQEMKTLVLSQSDEFYAKNMYKDYGAFTDNTKRMLDDYKEKYHQSKKSLSTVEEMTTLVENLPEFKKMANNALKHVAIVQEITSEVSRNHLFEISTLEQELVGPSTDHAAHLEKVKTKIKQPDVAIEHKLRLALLYALRYETHGGNRIGDIKQLLRQHKISEEQVKMVDAMLNYAGTARRTNPAELFGGGGDFFSKVRTLAIGVGAGSQVQNVLMQHKPLLAKILEEARTGRLSETRYPQASSSTERFVHPSPTPSPTPTSFAPPVREMIVLILGGATYSEAAVVAQINEASSLSSTNSFKVLLGGTYIHNSKTFLRELSALQF